VKTWQERRSSGKRGKSDVNVARATLSGNMNFFFYKFPLFCDNMDNFVHNAANKTSEFLQYVVVGFVQFQEMRCLIYDSLPDEFKGKDSEVGKISNM
jgi:hypothetical protein